MESYLSVEHLLEEEYYYNAYAHLQSKAAEPIMQNTMSMCVFTIHGDGSRAKGKALKLFLFLFSLLLILAKPNCCYYFE